MGFDLQSWGKPKSKAGNYFRNNVWFWRPLAQYVIEQTKCVDEFDVEGWGYNDNHLVPKETARAIAKQLRYLIKSGHTKKYAMAWEIKNKQIEEANDKVRKELAEFEREVCFKLNKKNLAPNEFPKTEHKKWEKIYDKINFDAYYPFSVQNVKDFAKFCEECEGFTIG